MCHAPRKEYYKKFLFEPLPGAWAVGGTGGDWARLPATFRCCLPVRPPNER